MRAGISVDLLTEKQVNEDFDTTVEKNSENYERRFEDMRDRAIKKSDEQAALGADGFDRTFARVDQDKTNFSGTPISLIRERQKKNLRKKQEKFAIGVEVGLQNKEKVIKRQKKGYEEQGGFAQQNTGGSNLAENPPERIKAFLENDLSSTKGPNTSLYGNDLRSIPLFITPSQVRQLQAHVVGTIIRGVDFARTLGERVPDVEDKVAFPVLDKLTTDWSHVFVGLFPDHIETAIADSPAEIDAVISKFPSGGKGTVAS